MSIKTFFLFSFFALIGMTANSQTDTVYFNANWEKSSKSTHSYYRIVNVNDTCISVVDYYKNGIPQMAGSVVNTDKSMESVRNGEDTEEFELGVFHYYNQDGSIYSYIDNNPNIQVLLDSGQIESVNVDSLVYEKTFYSNGQVKEEGLLTPEGLEHGKTIYYGKKGNVIHTSEFDKGVLDGKTVIYFSGGEVMRTIEYKKGVKHGEHKEYNFGFQLKFTKTYENGTLISTVKH